MNYDDFGLRIEYVEYTVKKEIVYIILLKSMILPYQI